MSEIGDLYVVLRAVTTPFTEGMRTAAAEGEASTGRISGALGKLSKIGVVAGAAAVTLGAVTVKMAGDFQAEMAKLNTQAGVAKDKIAGLSDGVLNLAGQVGFSPTSLAESLFHVESNFESMGISGSKALELVKVAAQGAAVGHADLVDVTNALTAAVASGIPGVQNFSQAMGVLNGIVGVGDMSMQDLANAFGSGMVATVKGFGLSITDVGAALAVFGDNNIRGSLAGNQLRMTVMALAHPVSSAGDALKRLGLDQDTLAKDMRSGGLLAGLKDLQEHMKKAGVGAKEQGQIITEAFGRKAGAGLNVLMDQMDRLESKYPALQKSAKGFGDSWAGTQATFNQQLHETEQGLVAMGIKLGTVLLPYVQRFLGWVRIGVNWLVQHKAAVEVLAGALGVTLVAAILAVGGALIAAIGPEELIAAGIMALGAGAVYAYRHFATFRTIVNTVASVLKVVFVGALHATQAAIQLLFGWFTAHRGTFVGAWQSMARSVQALARWFDVNVISWIRIQINELITWWRANSAQIAQVWRVVWDVMKTYAKVWWDGFMHPMLIVIMATWRVTWGVLRDTVKLVWGVITTVVSTYLHDVLNLITVLLDLATGRWGKAWRDMKKMVNDAINGAINIIISLTSGFATLLYDAGRNVIKGLISGMKSMIGSVKSAMGDVAGTIRNHLPFSPAKEGPLSGSGSPELGGRTIGRMIAQGLGSSVRDVQAASRRVAGAASLSVGGGFGSLAVGGAYGGYGAGVQQPIVVQVDGKKLFTVMQTRALRYGKRNPTTGLTYP